MEGHDSGVAVGRGWGRVRFIMGVLTVCKKDVERARKELLRDCC